jgi:hypothetical protein
MLGNGIRPIFIIRPKNAFIPGAAISDQLLQMNLGLS